MLGFRIWNKNIDIKLKVLEIQKNKKECPGHFRGEHQESQK